MTRPDENQSPGGFETAAELRQTEQREVEPEATPPPAMGEPPLAYARRSGSQPIVIAAAVLIVLLAVAVALYLVV